MKRIQNFRIIDVGVIQGMRIPLVDAPRAIAVTDHNVFVSGVGTDAESALDDLLYILQEHHYDVSGLESRIKERWSPSMDEGDGRSWYYHFGITYKQEE